MKSLLDQSFPFLSESKTEFDELCKDADKLIMKLKMKEVKCLNGKVEKPYMQKGKMVCTATHPTTPNFSGNSRGRKIHLAKDESKTVCNMLVDEIIPASDTNWTMVNNGKCKICFK